MTGLHSPCTWEGLADKTKPIKQEEFFTVADLPLQLSKPLQVLQNIDSAYTDFHPVPLLNIEQYNYDFSLERTVLTLFEDHDVNVRQRKAAKHLPTKKLGEL